MRGASRRFFTNRSTTTSMLQGVRRSATDKQSSLHWRLYSLFTAPSRSDGAPWNTRLQSSRRMRRERSERSVRTQITLFSQLLQIRQFTIAPLPKETQRPRCVKRNGRFHPTLSDATCSNHSQTTAVSSESCPSGPIGTDLAQP